MGKLPGIGRIFYGIAIAVIGLQTSIYRTFPYILSLPDNFSITGRLILACVLGLLFALCGTAIVFEIKARLAALLFGALLLLICCFYCIPYEFITGSNYLHLGEWENAEKELALAGGAFVIAGNYHAGNENRLTRFLSKLIPLGAILFAITIISFGILHFMVAKAAATLVPSWIPYPITWIYICGAALIGSGVSIVFKINTKLLAGLLGLMILLWFVLLHIPRVMVAPAADRTDEITSACLALAYSGIAFVICSRASKL